MKLLRTGTIGCALILQCAAAVLLPCGCACARASVRVVERTSQWTQRLATLASENEALRAQSVDDTTSFPVKVESLQIGQSQKGRPLFAVKISSPKAASGHPKCVFAVAGQHGDEPGGPEGALTLIGQFANSVDPAVEAVIRGTELYIVPVANPDGLAAGQRLTANRIDMNRDWRSRRSPEAKAIWSWITKLRPSALLDLHENTPEDRQGSCVLVAGGSSKAKAPVTRAFKKHGYAVPVSGASGSGGTLLHVEFARAFHRPAYLVETKYSSDPETGIERRGVVHLTAVMSVVKGLAPSSGAVAVKPVSKPKLVAAAASPPKPVSKPKLVAAASSPPKPLSEPKLSLNAASELLHLAAQGDAEKVKAMVGNDKSLIRAVDKNGATLLHYAAQSGNAEIVGILISQGADVNAKKNDGVTPLHVAAALGKTDATRALLTSGADPNATDAKGRTPLALARERGQQAVVQLMAKA